MEDKKLFMALVERNCEYAYTIGVLEGVFQMMDMDKLEEAGLIDVFDEIFKRYERLQEKFEKLVADKE